MNRKMNLFLIVGLMLPLSVLAQYEPYNQYQNQNPNVQAQALIMQKEKNHSAGFKNNTGETITVSVTFDDNQTKQATVQANGIAHIKFEPTRNVKSFQATDASGNQSKPLPATSPKRKHNPILVTKNRVGQLTLKEMPWRPKFAQQRNGYRGQGAQYPEQYGEQQYPFRKNITYPQYETRIGRPVGNWYGGVENELGQEQREIGVQQGEIRGLRGQVRGLEQGRYNSVPGSTWNR